MVIVYTCTCLHAWFTRDQCLMLNGVHLDRAQISIIIMIRQYIQAYQILGMYTL